MNILEVESVIKQGKMSIFKNWECRRKICGNASVIGCFSFIVIQSVLYTTDSYCISVTLHIFILAPKEKRKYPLIDSIIFFTDRTNRNAIKRYYHYGLYNP